MIILPHLFVAPQLREYPPSEVQQINEEGLSLNYQLQNLSSPRTDDPRQSYRSGDYSYDRRYHGPNAENDGNQKKRKAGPSDDGHSQRYQQQDLRTHHPFIPGDSSNPDMSLQSAFTVPHERHDYDPRQSYRSGAYSYDRRYGPNENDGNHEKRKTGTSDDEHSQRFLHHDLNTHRPIIPSDSRNPDMSPSAFAVPSGLLLSPGMIGR